MHDILIRGAQVYDGLGNPPKQADVAIDNGRISVIGKVLSRPVKRSMRAACR